MKQDQNTIRALLLSCFAIGYISNAHHVMVIPCSIGGGVHKQSFNTVSSISEDQDDSEALGKNNSNNSDGKDDTLRRSQTSLNNNRDPSISDKDEEEERRNQLIDDDNNIHSESTRPPKDQLTDSEDSAIAVFIHRSTKSSTEGSDSDEAKNKPTSKNEKVAPTLSERVLSFFSMEDSHHSKDNIPSDHQFQNSNLSSSNGDVTDLSNEEQGNTEQAIHQEVKREERAMRIKLIQLENDLNRPRVTRQQPAFPQSNQSALSLSNQQPILIQSPQYQSRFPLQPHTTRPTRQVTALLFNKTFSFSGGDENLRANHSQQFPNDETQPVAMITNASYDNNSLLPTEALSIIRNSNDLIHTNTINEEDHTNTTAVTSNASQRHTISISHIKLLIVVASIIIAINIILWVVALLKDKSPSTQSIVVIPSLQAEQAPHHRPLNTKQTNDTALGNSSKTPHVKKSSLRRRIRAFFGMESMTQHTLHITKSHQQHLIHL